MNIKMQHLLIVTVLFLMGCTTPDKNKIKISANTKNKLNKLFIQLSTSGEFNGNVLIAKHGTEIYQANFGYATGQQTRKLQATDRFNIGSIYKEIPAIAIMQLQENKQLDINHKISKYLVNLPNWSKNITIIQLLQYTSGLPKINWGSFTEINDTNLYNNLLTIKKLKFKPGTEYLYSNYSPFLLSKIVEKISNSRFTEYVQKHILQANGMSQSFFQNIYPYTNRNSMAIPFNDEYNEDNLPFSIKSSIFLFSTTVGDLFKLIRNLHLFKIINADSLNTIAKTAVLPNEDMQSALGNIQFISGQISSHTHHGSSGNYEAIISKNNINKLTIILLTNRKKSNLNEIITKITKILTSE